MRVCSLDEIKMIISSDALLKSLRDFPVLTITCIRKKLITSLVKIKKSSLFETSTSQFILDIFTVENK